MTSYVHYGASCVGAAFTVPPACCLLRRRQGAGWVLGTLSTSLSPLLIGLLSIYYLLAFCLLSFLIFRFSYLSYHSAVPLQTLATLDCHISLSPYLLSFAIFVQLYLHLLLFLLFHPYTSPFVFLLLYNLPGILPVKPKSSIFPLLITCPTNHIYLALIFTSNYSLKCGLFILWGRNEVLWCLYFYILFCF